MTIFENYEELKRDYIKAKDEYHKKRDCLPYMCNGTSLNNQNDLINELSVCLNVYGLAENYFEEAKRQIIEASSISFEEANNLVTKIMGNPFERYVGVESTQSGEYLVFYPDNLEEHAITLGKKAEDGLFYLYFESYDESLENFACFNLNSRGLKKLVKIINHYIECKTKPQCEVRNWDDYLKCYSFDYIMENEFTPVLNGECLIDEEYSIIDESLLDYYESIHEQEARKSEKRRERNEAEKAADCLNFKIRARRKIPEKYKKIIDKQAHKKYFTK